MSPGCVGSGIGVCAMKRLFFALAILALLTACGQPTTTPTTNIAPGAAGTATTSTAPVPTATPSPSPTQTATPTATPTPSATPSSQSSTSQPTEGTLFFHSPMTEIEPGVDESGSVGTVTAAGYMVTIPPDGEAFDVNSTLAGDASFSLTTRAVSPIGDGSGCLMFRAEVTTTDVGFYGLCLLYSGTEVLGVQAVYASTESGNTDPQVTDLGLYAPFPGLSSTEWNTIKVIAQGDHFWFLLNDELVGETTHSGRATGMIGYLAYNFDLSQEQSIEFRDFTIRSLASFIPTTHLVSAAAAPQRGQWQQPGRNSSLMVRLFKQIEHALHRSR